MSLNTIHISVFKHNFWVVSRCEKIHIWGLGYPLPRGRTGDQFVEDDCIKLWRNPYGHMKKFKEVKKCKQLCSQFFQKRKKGGQAEVHLKLTTIYRICTPHKLSVFNLWPKIVYAQIVGGVFGLRCVCWGA